ncbi:MAG: YggT family protein [Pseudomonadota bacterium]
MNTLIWLIGTLINIVFFLVLIQLILGLLIQFDILNRRQPLVFQIYNGVNQLLDPLLAPIRRILPPTGGLDFSPLVLLIGLQLLQTLLVNCFLRGSC